MDWSQQNSARSDEDVVADSRMSLADMLASTAESDVVKHYAVSPYLGGFTDDYTCAVVAEIPFANSCAGVDFKPGQKSADL